jgi:hypothetical protein
VQRADCARIVYNSVSRAHQLGTALAMQREQEVTTMVLDMTAHLAPMMWGMIALMVIAGASLLASHN